MPSPPLFVACDDIHVCRPGPLLLRVPVWMLKTWSVFPHLVGQPCQGFICVAAAGHTTAGADSAFPVVALWYQAVLVWVGRAFLVCLHYGVSSSCMLHCVHVLVLCLPSCLHILPSPSTLSLSWGVAFVAHSVLCMPVFALHPGRILHPHVIPPSSWSPARVVTSRIQIRVVGPSNLSVLLM